MKTDSVDSTLHPHSELVGRTTGRVLKKFTEGMKICLRKFACVYDCSIVCNGKDRDVW